MVVSLPDTERQLLRQAQRACRDKAGDVPVTALLLLDRGRAVAAIAEDLGLDEATVYRYAQTYQLMLRTISIGCLGRAFSEVAKAAFQRLGQIVA